MLPSTTPPQHHERTELACTQEQRHGGRIVPDDIDTLDHFSDDRVMQKANGHRVTNAESKVKGESHDGSCTWSGRVTRTTVLVIAGISTRSIDRALTDAGARCLQNGVALNVFDGLACLPSYSETLESRQLPRAVAALRSAARDAHAAIVLTDYYGQIPATVHNAIDWLTRGWNDGSLHDKPLAVIGATEGRYSGVWSRHQTDGSGRIGETRVIEPITVTTLHEAVTSLAEQANITYGPPSPLPVVVATNRRSTIVSR